MEASNATPTTTYWLCPLYFFDCDCESVDLAEGIQIKPAPTHLKDHIYEYYRSEAQRHDLSKFDWAAFLPYRRRNVEGLSVEERFLIGFEEHDRDRNSFVDLVTALRLYRSGRVVVGPLIFASIRNSKWSIGGSTIWTPVSNIWFFQEESKYTFRQPDVPEVDNLLQSIRTWRQTGVLDSVDIALRRFHSAYHGPIEDRIIDQMIAFESLYLGDPQELTYKLALRVAFLLGKRKDQRNGIFSDMKKAYSYRSRIVHGDNPPSRDELRDIVPKAEDYLRQSLRRFLLLLSQGHSLKEIREHLLDENILKNGKPLALGK